MKRLAGLLPLLLVLGGCAHGKMGQVDQPLDDGAITKTTPIFVESVNAANASFSGDKSADIKRTTEEKDEIHDVYNQKIAEALRAKGYNAKYVTEPAKSGIVITGDVTKIEHGSGAARFFVGMGAGSANMYTNFKIEDRSATKTLSKFQIIATSGGSSSTTSFLDTHMADGAKKVAEFVAGETVQK
jgi:hypothetical protein